MGDLVVYRIRGQRKNGADDNITIKNDGEQISPVESEENKILPDDEKSDLIEESAPPLLPIIVETLSLRQLLTEIIEISAPLLLFNMGDIATDMFANHFIVSLDDSASNAVNLIMTTRAFGMLTFSGMLLVTSNITSELKEAGKLIEVGIVYRQSLLLSCLLSIPSIILFSCSRPLLLAFGQQVEVVNVSSKFFNYFIINVPANYMLISMQQCLSGLKKQLILAAFNIGALPVFYFLGKLLASPDALGVNGVAVNYAIRSWGLLIAYHAYLFLSNNIDYYKLYSITDFTNEAAKFKEILKLGFPIVADVFGELGQFYLLNIMVGWLGGKSSTVQNVNSQYIFFSVTPSLALARSAGILIGGALGNKRYNNIKQYAYIHLGIGVMVMMTIAGLALLLSNQVANIFIPADDRNNDDVYKMIKISLFIYSICEIFDSIRNILTGSLRGLRSTVYPAVSNNMSLWLVSTPIAYILAFILNVGLPGIAIGQCVGMIVSNISLFVRWNIKSQQDKIEEEIKISQVAMTSENNEGLVKRCINNFFWSKPLQSTSSQPDAQAMSSYQNNSLLPN